MVDHQIRNKTIKGIRKQAVGFTVIVAKNTVSVTNSLKKGFLIENSMIKF